MCVCVEMYDVCMRRCVYVVMCNVWRCVYVEMCVCVVMYDVCL